MVDAVSRETEEKLREFVALVVAENDRQNLISRSTIDEVWERHVLDSLQLVPLGGNGETWCDIGSGAGFPGMVTAIATGKPTTLIEPRRLRADFLKQACEAIGLDNVRVVQSKAQSAEGQFDVISARAVAKAGELLGISSHLAHRQTIYLLMKGRQAQSELEDVKRAWQGSFELVPSATDAEASILVATGVTRGGKR